MGDTVACWPYNSLLCWSFGVDWFWWLCSSKTVSLLLRSMCVTVDGVSIGELIYWLLTGCTKITITLSLFPHFTVHCYMHWCTQFITVSTVCLLAMDLMQELLTVSLNYTLQISLYFSIHKIFSSQLPIQNRMSSKAGSHFTSTS
jgi:hypothetical protein